MKRAAAAIVASLACAACSTAGPPGVLPIDVGQPFSLRPGDLARTADDALRVGFTAVTADSRCPRGEQCLVAGDVTVRVWMQQGAGARQTGDLRTAPGQAQAMPLFGHVLRLLAVSPYPVSGKAIAPADYVATFTLSRGTLGDTTR